MIISHETSLYRLLQEYLGTAPAELLLNTLEIDASFAQVRREVTAAELAMALSAALFADLLQRVPTGAAYVAEAKSAGRHIMFDHGALRTVRFANGLTGHLPAGADAFSRILEPLGYQMAKAYPLPALRMTGYAWCHAALPETVPQFFVSELHVDRFSASFQEAATRVFGSTRDPLTSEASELLGHMQAIGKAPFELASAGFAVLVAAFDCHHETVAIADYEMLLAESAEAAWIATEGNAFNHATDRVGDVSALADQLRAAGYPIKPNVEYSLTGRVRQTALRADPVERNFVRGNETVTRTVPGSFYEFISRDVDPATGRLDLAFDSSNAQGIFAMTAAA